MSFSAVRPPQGSPTATTGPNRIQMSYAMRRLQTSRWQAMKFFEHKSKPSRLAGLAWMSCLTCKGNNEIASVTANLMLSSRHWPTSCSKLDMQVNHCEDCLQRCLTNLADCWDLKGVKRRQKGSKGVKRLHVKCIRIIQVSQRHLSPPLTWGAARRPWGIGARASPKQRCATQFQGISRFGPTMLQRQFSLQKHFEVIPFTRLKGEMLNSNESPGSSNCLILTCLILSRSNHSQQVSSKSSLTLNLWLWPTCSSYGTGRILRVRCRSRLSNRKRYLPRRANLWEYTCHAMPRHATPCHAAVMQCPSVRLSLDKGITLRNCTKDCAVAIVCVPRTKFGTAQESFWQISTACFSKMLYL